MDAAVRNIAKRLVFALLGIAIAAAVFSLVRQPQGADISQSTGPSTIASEEDPEARAQWEWMRLHDPSTGEIPLNIRSKELQFAASLPTRESMTLAKGGSTSGSQLLTWYSRGPYNVGGRTRALGVDVTNENVILAGGASGGMWRSTDGGSSWTKTTQASQLHSVTCLAQDTRSQKTSIWYYGTGEYLGNSASGGAASYRGDGIFKTTDGGSSWLQLPSTVTGTPQTFSNGFQYVWNILVDPNQTNADVVYAATYDAIFRSTNGGSSWTALLGNSSPSSPYTDVAITSAGVVYATLSSGGGSRGIWRSADGITWTNITPTGWPSTYNRIVIGIAPSNQNVVYFLAETSGFGLNNHSLWKYTYLAGDGAGSNGTWVNRSSNIPAFGGLTGNFDSQRSYDLLIKVHPTDENTVFIGGTNLFRSTDGFATNTKTTWIGGYTASNNSYALYPNHHPDQHAITFSPTNPNIMFSGHDGGVSKTTNNLASSISWNSLNFGYLTTQFYTVAIDQATIGSDVIVGGMQDNGDWFYNSTLPTASWTLLLTGDGAACAIADGRTSYYLSYQQGVSYRFILSDGGTVQSFTRIDPTGGSGYLFINAFVLDPNDNKIMYLAGGNVLWRNRDLTGIPLSSNSTTNVNWDSLASTWASGYTITAVSGSKTPANRVYYASYKGSSPADSKVHRLDGVNTGSPTPVDISTGKGLPTAGSAVAYVSCIAVDPTNGDRALVVFSNYNVISLYYTSDAGATWTPVAGNLEQNTDGSGIGPSCRWALILPSSSGSKTYYVGTSTGLYSTTTLSGMSTVWAQEGASTIGSVVVDMVVGRQVDGVVVAATHGNGIYSSSPTTASAGILLAYDSGSPQSSVYESLPNSGWILANRLTAPNRNVKIEQLSYYYRGDHANGNGSFFPVVYASSVAQSGIPAAAAFYTGASYTPAGGWNDIDISAQNLSLSSTTSAEFFVGVKYNGSTEPQIGYTGSSNGRGWEYDPTKFQWTALDVMNPPFPATLFIRATVSLLTGIAEISTQVPKDFWLSENYPNPFNPSTTIQYALPREESVVLKIYDVRGREVATMVDGLQAAGTYTFRWNGKDNAGLEVGSGVYFYRLKAGDYSAAKKMLLIR